MGDENKKQKNRTRRAYMLPLVWAQTQTINKINFIHARRHLLVKHKMLKPCVCLKINKTHKTNSNYLFWTFYSKGVTERWLYQRINSRVPARKKNQQQQLVKPWNQSAGFFHITQHCGLIQCTTLVNKQARHPCSYLWACCVFSNQQNTNHRCEPRWRLSISMEKINISFIKN